MYLHLGEKTVIRIENIVGIFDLDNTTVKKSTRNFLRTAQNNKEVVNVSFELPKSFIVCVENDEKKVYISQIAATTLYKRIKNI